MARRTTRARVPAEAVFDGTGKQVLNTCGRIIGRLRPAGYRVHVCVVLASYDACMARIRARFEATGRDVPLPIVQGTFEMLKYAVGVYIRKQAGLCDRVLVYDNDGDGAPALLATVANGQGVDVALAAADKYLEATWKGTS